MLIQNIRLSTEFLEKLGYKLKPNNPYVYKQPIHQWVRKIGKGHSNFPRIHINHLKAGVYEVHCDWRARHSSAFPGTITDNCLTCREEVRRIKKMRRKKLCTLKDL